MFSVVTDTSHTAGLTMHATILAYVFALVESGKVNISFLFFWNIFIFSVKSLCSVLVSVLIQQFLTARRRGSKKTFDGTLLLHYEKSCQNAFEQCLNLFKPPKTFKCPLHGCCLCRAAAFTESSKRICFMFTQV